MFNFICKRFRLQLNFHKKYYIRLGLIFLALTCKNIALFPIFSGIIRLRKVFVDFLLPTDSLSTTFLLNKQEPVYANFKLSCYVYSWIHSCVIPYLEQLWTINVKYNNYSKYKLPPRYKRGILLLGYLLQMQS